MLWVHYSGYRLNGGNINRLTRLQLDAICKMQELIELAKSGKSENRVISHREFVSSMKGKVPSNFKYDKCSEDAKKRWLSIVGKK